jgi:hypothetical protein
MILQKLPPAPLTLTSLRDAGPADAQKALLQRVPLVHVWNTVDVNVEDTVDVNVQNEPLDVSIER